MIVEWFFSPVSPDDRAVGILPEPSRISVINDECTFEWTTPGQTVSVFLKGAQGAHVHALRAPVGESVELVSCQNLCYAFRKVAEWTG